MLPGNKPTSPKGPRLKLKPKVRVFSAALVPQRDFATGIAAMEDAADPSVLIISRLENGSDYAGLYRQVSSFLLPFAPLVSFDSQDPSVAAVRSAGRQQKAAPAAGRKKKTGKGKVEAEPDSYQLRSLAKKFLPFLSRVLKLLPSLIPKCKDGNGGSPEARFAELFSVYRLALDCLQCIMPCLTGKPYSVHLQRVRLVSCLESCGRYPEAEEEAYLLLESLKSAMGSDIPKMPKRGKPPQRSHQFIPALSGDYQGDVELSLLLVEIVAIIVGSKVKRKTRDSAPYERIMILVEEVRPWLRSIDEEKTRNHQAMLVNTLFKCGVFLASESLSFRADLVVSFCMLVLRVSLESPLANQLTKIATTICSSFQTRSETRNLLILDMLRFMVESIPCDCKVDVVYSVNDLLELVFYGVESNADTETCKEAVEVLAEGCESFKDFPTISSILNLYAIGLYFALCCKEYGTSTSCPLLPCDASLIPLLLGTRGERGLLKSLDLLQIKFLEKKNQHEELIESVNVDSTSGPSLGQKHLACTVCSRNHGQVCMLSHFNALEFMCRLFWKFVTITWKPLFLQGNVVEFFPEIVYIQPVIFEFHKLYFKLTRSVALSEKQSTRLNESRVTLLHALLTGFRLSLGVGTGIQESRNCIDDLIKSNWIDPQELQVLISSLYSVGASFYNDKSVEKAYAAFKLCYKALWTHARRISDTGSIKLSYNKMFDSSLDIIETAIEDACAKSADILKVAHQCQDSKLDELMLIFFSDWSTVSDKIGKMFNPTVLVRQWVKTVCKNFENGERSYVPSLCDLICRRDSVSGFIFEQELAVYREFAGRSPQICQEMQLRIIDTLLNDIYVVDVFPLQRARLLVRKGSFLRASGAKELNSCLQCLCEAISLLEGISSNSQEYSDSWHHHLAVAHCLRAYCTQEDSQNIEAILNDVRSALHIFSGFLFSDPVCKQFDGEPWITIVLLCNIFDLMSMKGCLSIQYEIVGMIHAFWKRQNEPFEKFVAFLWGDRRLSHALCSLPINDRFIEIFSNDLGILDNTADFLFSCVRDSPPLMVALLQKLLPFNLIINDTLIYDCERFHGHRATTENVEAVCSSLVSNVPLSNYSAFTAAHLYYDLSERLFSCGRLTEALKYSREALQLRQKLLQRKFEYTVRKKSMDATKSGESTWDHRNHIHLEAFGSEIYNVWPSMSKSSDFGHSVIGPWNVLNGYLESILQVATIYDLIGDEAEAEAYLQIGKRISNLQGLPLHGIHFMCQLGNVFCKKLFFDLAKQELDNAKLTMQKSRIAISCKHCKLSLEVLLDMHLGDYYRSLSERDSQSQTTIHISSASSVYKTAVERLISSTLSRDAYQKFGNDVMKKETNDTSCRFSSCQNCVLSSSMRQNYEALQGKLDGSLSKVEVAAEGRPKRKSKNSIILSKKNLIQNTDKDTIDPHLSSSCKFSLNNLEEMKKSFSRKNCWACLLVEISIFGSLENMIYARLEWHHRRVLLNLLPKLAQCVGITGDSHDLHELFHKSFALLFLRNCNHVADISVQFSSLNELIGPGYNGNIFPVELAVILYELSCFFIKNCLSENGRAGCSCLSEIELSSVIHWLMQAFVFSHELGILFKKISLLLATSFMLSTLGSPYTLHSNLTKNLSVCHWASFFHQSSIGTCLDYQYPATLSEKTRNRNVQDLHSYLSGDFTIQATGLSLLSRIRLENFLEDYVLSFFKALPDFTVVCISLLEGIFSRVLEEALLLPTVFPAWMLLSRYDSKEPVTLILPINCIIEDGSLGDAECHDGSLSGQTSETKEWQCPWNCTVLDTVAPQYKSILEDNYLSLSTSVQASTDIQRNRNMWWSRRASLDNRLCRLLRDIEDAWFGSWKCLLLGRCIDTEYMEKMLTKFCNDLECECNFKISTNIIRRLRTIVNGAISMSAGEECLKQLLSYGGYFGTGECCGCLRIFSTDATEESEGFTAYRVLMEGIGKHLKETIYREPIILVLDANIQMLPWENLPILRKQEVYRMPSLGCILEVLKCKRETLPTSVLPLVDPLDAYYLLNPSGDLLATQAEFEELFRAQNWEGKAGNAPPSEELLTALQQHDLFIYFGHGSGANYMPGTEIKKLRNCAASLLMGCSSGCLSVQGYYAPRGIPLSYLSAGCPALIANLWDVSDKDIDRFGKAVVSSWLHEDTRSVSCTCEGIVEELKQLHVDVDVVKRCPRTKRNVQRSKKFQDSGTGLCRSCLQLRITSCLSQARDMCKLPFLIGAAPVCYGVPTLIKKNSKVGLVPNHT